MASQLLDVADPGSRVYSSVAVCGSRAIDRALQNTLARRFDRRDPLRYDGLNFRPLAYPARIRERLPLLLGDGARAPSAQQALARFTAAASCRAEP